MTDLLVVNARDNYTPQFGDIYIGRRHSKFPPGHVACQFPPEWGHEWSYPYGNPFIIGPQGDGNRDQVLVRFNEWIDTAAGEATLWELMAHINWLLDTGAKQIRLVCWCAPRGCHGHVYQNEINISD